MELPDLGFVLINAVVLACIYGTLAIGISITWSSVGLINLAYGFIYAAAGYGAWMTAQHITATGLTADKIGNVLVSIGFVAAVVMWMRSSRRGLEIRAMMMNPHAAAIV